MNSTDPPTTKIGQGHASAMLRQGLKELQAGIMTESNVAREPEPGTFGTPTQGEIAAERKTGSEPSIIDQHTARARSQSSPQAERNTEPERE